MITLSFNIRGKNIPNNSQKKFLVVFKCQEIDTHYAILYTITSFYMSKLFLLIYYFSFDRESPSVLGDAICIVLAIEQPWAQAARVGRRSALVAWGR